MLNSTINEAPIQGLPIPATQSRLVKKTRTASVAPKSDRKRPRSAKQTPTPAVEHWLPETGTEGEPGYQTAPAVAVDPAIAWIGRVRYRIPKNTSLEFDGDTPSRIKVPLGDNAELVITGDPSILSAIDTKNKTCLVQGTFTAMRNRSHIGLRSVSLVVDDSQHARYELLRLPDLPGNRRIHGKGWLKRLSSIVIQVVATDDDVGQKLAA